MVKWTGKTDQKDGEKMKKYNRIFTIVIDSLGVGAMPDAAQYGDAGCDTLGHIAERTENFQIPNLQKLGMANLHTLQGVAPAEKPLACHGKLREASKGKDTMTGHWEMMGLQITTPFQTFTEHGFPPELIAELEKRTGHKVIGNKSASGTAILDELAEEEIATGHMIVYTSADSVLQICGNEETFGLDELYRCCEIARELTMKDEWKVGRVIARPYVGRKKGEFKRTSNRHDYALKPFGRTALNVLKDAGLDVISVGKIYDIFAGRGITKTYPNEGNQKNMERVRELMEEEFNGLCFVNLVDFDMLYGHRNDIDGYVRALNEVDRQLGMMLEKMKEEDLLIITADHGCDPGFKGTDHSREYTPCLCYGANLRQGVDLGIRKSFSDIAQTIAQYLKIEFSGDGTGFLQEIMK
mgnify:CR=1 FL=1